MGGLKRAASKIIFGGDDHAGLSRHTCQLREALREFDGSLNAWSILQKRGRSLLYRLDPITYDTDVQKHLGAYMIGSRAWLHTEVEEWFLAKTLSDEDLSDKLFWLRAGAGMGKSVFAASLIDRMRREHPDRLIGSVFFNFNDGKKSDPKLMLRSLTFQLVKKFPELSDFVKKALTAIERETQTTALLFEDLFLASLLELQSRRCGADEMENMIMIVDALDEAGSEGSDSRNALLHLFSTKLIHKLPRWVKLFVTGRPEADIVAQLGKYSHVIDDDDPRHLRDLEDYISYSIAEVIGSGPELVKATALLLRKSEGKFVYTAAVADEIESWHDAVGDRELFIENFTKRLEALPDGISDCYKKTFDKLYKSVGKEEALRFLRVLVASLEPLSEQEVRVLVVDKSNAKANDFAVIVARLATVYPLRECDGVKKFQPFHKSIVDWLQKPENGCEAGRGHLLIAQSLLRTLDVDTHALFSASASSSATAAQAVLSCIPTSLSSKLLVPQDNVLVVVRAPAGPPRPLLLRPEPPRSLPVPDMVFPHQPVVAAVFTRGSGAGTDDPPVREAS